MKILHLSDLHIGKSVNGFAMLDEQKNVFSQITAYIDSHKPDAVLIAGDIYDRSIPGIEAVRVFDDFLTALATTNTTVMLISGNHDSPERLNFASRLLSNTGIHLCGAFENKLQSVQMEDKHGKVFFWLLPFIKPSSVRGNLDAGEIETYDDALKAALGTGDIDYAQRNVLVSHQFFTGKGATLIRSESEMNPVGGLDAIDVSLIDKFDYVALGHLHRAQKTGADHIRYAGSPLKYSFSEVDHEKSVTLVELGAKGSISITQLPLKPIHNMREIKGKLEEVISAASTSSADNEDYLRVILTDEEEIIDPMGKIRSVYPNVMALDFANSRTDAAMTEIQPRAEQLESFSLFDLFSEFFLDASGSAMSKEQEKIVQNLLESEALQ